MAERLPEKLRLEIVTPNRQIYCGDVDEVSVPGIHGYMGILPGHAPLLSELKVGVIGYRTSGSQWVRLFCGWGFVEVLADQVSVLAEEAELPEEIDPEQASQDKLEAEALLRSRAPDTDYGKALEVWESSVARLESLGP